MTYDPNIEQTYRLMRERDPRRAAEIAYVLAVLSVQTKQMEDARRYGQESIELFKASNVESLEAACPRYTNLNDVPLPNLIHEGVVRQRLQDLGVTLSSS